MNETIQTILARRSIRRFSQEPVTAEELDQVIQCGLYAASGGNHQVARLLVFRDRDRLDELARLAREEFLKMEPVEGQYWNTAIYNARSAPEQYDFTFHAPVLIVVTAPADWPNGMADSAGALQNMQVAASALGLGACWVNQLRWLTKNETLRSWLSPYGFRPEEDVFGSMVLGHPAGPAPAPLPRKAGRAVLIPPDGAAGGRP